jgi:hypothetical protein
VQGYVSDVDMYGNDECYWTSYMCLDVSLARYCVALHCAAAFVFGCLDDGGVEMPEPLDVVGLFLIFVIASTTGPVTIYRLCVCVQCLCQFQKLSYSSHHQSQHKLTKIVFD